MSGWYVLGYFLIGILSASCAVYSWARNDDGTADSDALCGIVVCLVLFWPLCGPFMLAWRQGELHQERDRLREK